MYKKFKCIAILAVLFLISFSSAGAQDSSGELRMALENLTGEILDPIAGPTDCKWYQTLLYDSLVGLKPGTTELSAETGLARKWEHSSDYKTWTFHLRQGVFFHNGDELTAADVKFTLERAIGPESKSTNRSSLIKTIDNIQIVDKYTVQYWTNLSQRWMFQFVLR